MPIHFIPNDVATQQVFPMRRITPRPERPSHLVGFEYPVSYPVDLYPPGTPGFLFWQSREAALWALEVWESIAGRLPAWVNNRRKLRIRLRTQQDLNAYYDRQQLIFYQYTYNGHTTYTGASTDVVAHEVGHALLDAMRPELQLSRKFEVMSFREGFGDFIAIMTALSDSQIRATILPDIFRTNPVERFAEDLAEGKKRRLPNLSPQEQIKYENGTVARSARNNFQWKPEGDLNDYGPPGELIKNSHSFGQVISGCFYDTLLNIFRSFTNQDSDSLWKATQITGKLVHIALDMVVEKEGFFRSFGQSMLLADHQINGGIYRTAILKAFAEHNIDLDDSEMLAVVGSLSGSTLNFSAASPRAAFSSTQLKELRQQLEVAPNTKLQYKLRKIAGKNIIQVSFRREIPLDGLSKQLQHAVTYARESIYLSNQNSKVVLYGDILNATQSKRRMRSFAEKLIRNKAVSQRKKSSQLVSSEGPALHAVTHALRKKGDKLVLERWRFS